MNYIKTFSKNENSKEQIIESYENKINKDQNKTIYLNDTVIADNDTVIADNYNENNKLNHNNIDHYNQDNIMYSPKFYKKDYSENEIEKFKENLISKNYSNPTAI